MSRLEKIKQRWDESKGKFYLDELIAPEDVDWLIGRVTDLEFMIEDIKELAPDLTIFECGSKD